MPKILVCKADNIVQQVADEVFEFHSDYVWKNVEDDNVQQGWTYVPATNSVFDTHAEWLKTDEGKRQTMVENRQQGYGKITDQLDALYRDLKDGTTKWVDHISAVKAANPKVARTDPLEKDTVTGE